MWFLWWLVVIFKSMRSWVQVIFAGPYISVRFTNASWIILKVPGRGGLIFWHSPPRSTERRMVKRGTCKIVHPCDYIIASLKEFIRVVFCWVAQLPFRGLQYLTQHPWTPLFKASHADLQVYHGPAFPPFAFQALLPISVLLSSSPQQLRWEFCLGKDGRISPLFFHPCSSLFKLVLFPSSSSPVIFPYFLSYLLYSPVLFVSHLLFPHGCAACFVLLWLPLLSPLLPPSLLICLISLRSASYGCHLSYSYFPSAACHKLNRRHLMDEPSALRLGSTHPHFIGFKWQQWLCSGFSIYPDMQDSPACPTQAKLQYFPWTVSQHVKEKGRLSWVLL